MERGDFDGSDRDPISISPPRIVFAPAEPACAARHGCGSIRSGCGRSRPARKTDTTASTRSAASACAADGPHHAVGARRRHPAELVESTTPGARGLSERASKIAPRPEPRHVADPLDEPARRTVVGSRKHPQLAAARRAAAQRHEPVARAAARAASSPRRPRTRAAASVAKDGFAHPQRVG